MKGAIGLKHEGLPSKFFPLQLKTATYLLVSTFMVSMFSVLCINFHRLLWSFVIARYLSSAHIQAGASYHSLAASNLLAFQC